MNDLEHDSLYSDWPKSVTEVSSVCSSLYMLTLGARISLYQPLLTLCRCTHQPLSAFVDTLLVHISVSLCVINTRSLFLIKVLAVFYLSNKVNFQNYFANKLTK